MAMNRQEFPPEGNPAVHNTARKGRVGRDIGIYAILILLVVGELHVLHRIDQMRGYVDQRNSQLRAGLQDGFRKKLNAANAAQREAMQSATKQIDRHLLAMQARARQAQAEADQAARRLEQMQAAEDGALASIQQMLAQKSSASQLRALNRQVAQTREDVDFAGAQLARLHAQVGHLEGVTTGQITSLSDQLAAVRRESPGFRQFRLVLHHSQSVGGIDLLLTKTRRKHNRFNVLLVAGSKRLEKKNAAVGEPIFFVPGKPATTYEVVVDSVGRNEVHGFIGAPREVLPSTSHR